MAIGTIPFGYHMPYATVTDVDHTAWIIIAASLGIVYATIFGAIRALVRYTSGASVGLDDATLGAATVSMTSSTEVDVFKLMIVIGSCDLTVIDSSCSVLKRTWPDELRSACGRYRECLQGARKSRSIDVVTTLLITPSSSGMRARCCSCLRLDFRRSAS